MNFSFDAMSYPYASRRSVVYGRRGMVATANPLAAQASPWWSPPPTASAPTPSPWCG